MSHRIVHVDDLSEPLVSDVAVVVDVLRAFTVAPWCLARGADRHLLAPSLEAAVSAGERHSEALLLKDGAPDARFALPNAPGVLATADLSRRTIIQKTGNGTRGAHAARGARTVLCASFVTAGATTEFLRARPGREVTFVVTEGDEDVALAEYVIARLSGAVDPAPYLQRVHDSAAGRELRERAPDPAFPGVHVDDLRLAMELDRFDHALRCQPLGDLLEVGRVTS